MGVVHATITGTPVLGDSDHYAIAPTLFTIVVTSIDVIAGTPSVASSPAGHACDNGVCNYTPAFFGISFGGVTFSGASFYLYISTNGFSNINTTAGDIKFAGPFAANALASAEASQAAGLAAGIVGANYWIGNVGGGTIVGPIPVEISTAYQYIKVYDGSCGTTPTFCGGTGVAGAKQLVNVQPGITIDQTKGPAWTSLHVSGGGFAANQHVDINYTFTFHNWAAGAASLKKGAITTNIATGPGYFGPILMSMVDTKQSQNPPTGPYQGVPITVTAVNSTSHNTILNAAQNTVAPVIFTEFSRQFNQASSYFSGSTVSVSAYAANAAAYGNATCTGVLEPCAPAPKYSSSGAGFDTYVPGQYIDVFVTGTLGIVGSNFTVNGNVTIWLGGVNVGTVAANSNGHFVANVTVPKLPVGINLAQAVADGVDYQFTIYVNPTLLLSPNTGTDTPTATVVTATAYGFPANAWVSLWWFEHAAGDGNNYFLLNSTIDSTGSFNHTITFVVPHAYGGGHDVTASQISHPSPVSEATLEGAGFVTETTFTITPTLYITPTSTPDNGSKITVVGEGLTPPGITCVPGGYNSKCTYTVNIDNAVVGFNAPLCCFGVGQVAANATGDLILTFQAAGFRPGLHQVWLTGPNGPMVAGSRGKQGIGSYSPTVHAYFTITTTGDPIADQLTALNTAVSGLSTSLTSIQTSLTNIQSSLTSVQSSLSGVVSTLSSVTSSLSGITSTLSAVQTSLSGISSSVSNIQSSLTTITGDVSGLGTQLSSLQAAATSLQNSASSLSTSVGNLATQLTSVQNSLTSMGSQLSSIATDAHTAATQATAAAASAASAVNGNATAQTYVLVVAVLAAITLVLELAILVRKLS